MEIIIEQLCKAYDEKIVLNNLNLRFSGPGHYCLMGPSGQGKTTLLNIMMGLVAADSGQISGLDKYRISAVFQEDRLLENLSGGANLRLVAPKGTKNQRIIEILNRLNLPDALHQPVREMSGGMMRRVSIGRALIHDGDIIIMDEPFKGLDEDTKKHVMQYVKETTRDKMLIWVTHEVSEAEFIGSQIIHL